MGGTLGFASLTPTYTTYAILASHLVIPAKAGIQELDERPWIPAFAGMTDFF
jgi:hypothetical protein